MKNRGSIKFKRTNVGFIGTLQTSDTFIVTRGTDKKEIRKEIKEALREF